MKVLDDHQPIGQIIHIFIQCLKDISSEGERINLHSPLPPFMDGRQKPMFSVEEEEDEENDGQAESSSTPFLMELDGNWQGQAICGCVLFRLDLLLLDHQHLPIIVETKNSVYRV